MSTLAGVYGRRSSLCTAATPPVWNVGIGPPGRPLNMQRVVKHKNHGRRPSRHCLISRDVKFEEIAEEIDEEKAEELECRSVKGKNTATLFLVLLPFLYF